MSRGPFAHEIGNLVRCRCDTDFEIVKALYEPLFASVEESNLGSLNKALERVGLAFRRGQIVVQSSGRWREVSMKEMGGAAMPTTTNSLESSHRHSNARTPRRNTLWESMHRIVGAMLTKSTTLWGCIQYNSPGEARKSFRRASNMDLVMMQQEVRYSQATPASCNYGETIHLSRIYRVSMPCSHQYSLDVVKPSVPQEFNISFQGTWNSKCVLDMRTLEREIPNESPAHIMYVKDLAVRNIRHFSGSRKKEEISEYVEANLVVGPELALGLPMSVLGLISEGIEHFRKRIVSVLDAIPI
jgi:hypothetical protein